MVDESPAKSSMLELSSSGRSGVSSGGRFGVSSGIPSPSDSGATVNSYDPVPTSPNARAET